nr:orotate phosphoribosyltransferase [Marinicella rhabdoformis]
MDTAQEFLQLAVDKQVLKFGEFTLKSGRVSPYFFNAGLFDDGASLAQLGRFYAQTIVDSGVEFDMLYGPAYKGIPLATAISVAFYDMFDRNVPVCFNRKEAKGHGEGGQLIGAPLKGNVLIVDDVVSAGTSVRESIEMIRQNDAITCGVAVALDRQERGEGMNSAMQELHREFDVETIAIANLESLLDFLAEDDEALQKVKVYRARFGV